MNMSDEEDYSSEDDLDYVPTAEDVSEEEGSGDEEDLTGLTEDASQVGKVGGRKERRKAKNELAARKRKGGIKLEGEEEPKDTPENGDTDGHNLGELIAQEKEVKKEENEKKKANDLWSSFLSDVKTPPVRKPQCSSSGLGALSSVAKPALTSPKPSPQNASKPDSTSGKMTITKVFDFAGEEVKVTKEVDVTSKEAQDELRKQSSEKEETKPTTTSDKPSVLANIGVKRPASGGGLGGLLSKIGKKPKISVLDKSKMDWDTFKKDEGIEDDMKIHNRGKESYLERIAFLNRADVRQFEIEKSLRLGSSSKR